MHGEASGTYFFITNQVKSDEGRLVLHHPYELCFYSESGQPNVTLLKYHLLKHSFDNCGPN